MPRLALYTFGVLKSPLAADTPLTRELKDSGAAVYGTIGRQPGYLGRAEAVDGGRGPHFDLDWGVWGEFAVPAWYEGGRTARTTALDATLSLWTDLGSAVDAVFTGLHREALNRRHDWFERTGRPSHACWWLGDEAIPTWQDGVSRLEHVHEHGPAPHAFTLHHSFGPDGTPARTGPRGVGPKGDRVR
ncbi:DUF3291 domain-containing protein [Streptomyces showdoensis]|uniref:DUF3291 domain-containing protein n=1 Tax=Streptomyces showdoensis TaxID=68268 RepID=A0A2P2GHP5_STREW|nr:DUF3291 domain-containing protein [Streptomyces showdoensis]KKZ71018.1 hypothetical protein VO63_25815 [Streptomyces showdoensis]